MANGINEVFPLEKYDQCKFMRNPVMGLVSNICSEIHCDFICIPGLKGQKAECLCPDKTLAHGNTCFCEKEHPDCFREQVLNEV